MEIIGQDVFRKNGEPNSYEVNTSTRNLEYSYNIRGSYVDRKLSPLSLHSPWRSQSLKAIRDASTQDKQKKNGTQLRNEEVVRVRILCYSLRYINNPVNFIAPSLRLSLLIQSCFTAGNAVIDDDTVKRSNKGKLGRT